MADFSDFGLLSGQFNTTLPTLTNEQLTELQVDSNGRLIISGRWLAGTDAFVGGDALVGAGAVRNDAEGPLATVDDGDWTPLQTDSNGRLKVATVVSVEPSDAEFLEDTAHSSGDALVHVGLVRQDTLTASNDTDGDYGSFKSNNVGELYVVDATGRTTLASIDTTLSNLSVLEDAAHISGAPGIQLLAVRADADGPLTDADGDYSSIQTDANGYLKVILKDSSVSIAPFGVEAYTVTDALVGAGDGLETITAAATPWVAVATLSVPAGTTAFVYGWQFACDQNCAARIMTDDTTDEVVYKTSVNSSAKPAVEEHFASEGVIEVAGAANLELRIEMKKRATPGGNAQGTGSLHVRTVTP